MHRFCNRASYAGIVCVITQLVTDTAFLTKQYWCLCYCRNRLWPGLQLLFSYWSCIVRSRYCKRTVGCVSRTIGCWIRNYRCSNRECASARQSTCTRSRRYDFSVCNCSCRRSNHSIKPVGVKPYNLRCLNYSRFSCIPVAYDIVSPRPPTNVPQQLHHWFR